MKLEDQIRTTPHSGSIQKVTQKQITFDELWKNYPSEESIKHNAKEIKDYCAIKVGESLIKSGIILKHKSKGGTYNGNMCWGCPSGKNNTHPLLAQDLANWLLKKPFAGCPKVQKLTGEEFRKVLNEKTGIIFFKDYWRRNGETGESRTGDHIDLWDSRGVDKLRSQGRISNFLTNTLGIYWDGWYSDKNKSKEVWFWEIK